MSRYDIVFIGTAIVDAILKGFDPKPVSATGYRADSCSLHAGGEAVNGAIAAAKLGMKTAILCALGKDAAGNMIEAQLAAIGVDTSLIVRSADHPTPVTTMFVAEDGSRRSITNKAHRYNFHPERYADAMADTGAVVLGSLFRAPFDDPDVVRTIAAAAREKGVPIFADTKLPNFTKLRLEDLADSLPLIDCITPNEEEARYYSGKDDPEKMADAFLDTGVGSVIVKLGGKGCLFKNREKKLYLPACPIAAVDASGAGDNFLAGYVSEILRGSSVDQALTFANACGAICTTAVGACTALQDRHQVEAFIKEMSEK
ncbi:MAG: carbohydrate kinase family protein [Firmicutes bacterium]|nr:carbohydrate kinase family protein [Bacillota bacterium]